MFHIVSFNPSFDVFHKIDGTIYSLSAGKGTNVFSRLVNRMDESSLKLHIVLGSENKEEYLDLLKNQVNFSSTEELISSNLLSVVIFSGKTRVNNKYENLDSSFKEDNKKGEVLSLATITKIANSIENSLKLDEVNYVVLTGSVTSVICYSEIYFRLKKYIDSNVVKLIIDCQKDSLEYLLNTDDIFLCKVNNDEINFIVNDRDKIDSYLLNKHLNTNFLITGSGKYPELIRLANSNEVTKIYPQKIKVLHRPTVGCGDSVLSEIIYRIYKATNCSLKLDLLEIFKESLNVIVNELMYGYKE